MFQPTCRLIGWNIEAQLRSWSTLGLKSGTIESLRAVPAVYYFCIPKEPEILLAVGSGVTVICALHFM
jgi:hypothetical protein